MTLIVPTPDPRPTYLAKLNAEQRRAVEHGVDASCSATPPLLVIAGAGSGKTSTLAHRVGHLIAHGVDPNRIMLLTFSRRAAAEMARQAALIAPRVLGRRACLMTDGLPWSGTFHAIGARLLRDHADAVGLNPAFTIHDREDSADLMNLIRNDLGLSNLGLSNSGGRFPAKTTCLSIYSHCVNAQRALEETLRLFFPWSLGWAAELRQLFAGYVEAKQRQNLLDYDDLLLYWAQAVRDEVLAQHMGGRFDHILVDEYQDTNRLQSSILLGLKPDGHGLAVVGDDAQSIYSFRSATVRNILDFPKHFQPAAAVITLDRNYRSSQPLLAAANGVIDLAAERFTKNLWTDRDGDQRPRPSPSRTQPTRRAISPRQSWKIAKVAHNSNSRRSCSERRATARFLKSSSRAETYPSKNSAALNSWTPRISRISWPCCGSSRTLATAYRACACCF